MRLYTYPLSSNGRRVLLVACELGIDLELVMVDLSKNEHREPDYLTLNPNGKVPHFVDGDLHLWESQERSGPLPRSTSG